VDKVAEELVLVVSEHQKALLAVVLVLNLKLHVL
jgi:hypothetical protein